MKALLPLLLTDVRLLPAHADEEDATNEVLLRPGILWALPGLHVI